MNSAYIRPEERHYPDDGAVEDMLSGLPQAEIDWHLRAYLKESTARVNAASEYLAAQWKDQATLKLLPLTDYHQPFLELWQKACTPDTVKDICHSVLDSLDAILDRAEGSKQLEPIKRPRLRFIETDQGMHLEIIGPIDQEGAEDMPEYRQPEVSSILYQIYHAVTSRLIREAHPGVAILEIAWNCFTHTLLREPQVLTPFLHHLAIQTEDESCLIVSNLWDKDSMHPQNSLDLFEGMD